MRITGKIAHLTALHVSLTICCQAAKGQAQSSKPSPDLTVWVENWAEVSPLMLASAEKAAGRIFRKARIEVSWREISATPSRRSDSAGREGQKTFEPSCLLTALNS
jgi:hypothetical protein